VSQEPQNKLFINSMEQALFEKLIFAQAVKTLPGFLHSQQVDDHVDGARLRLRTAAATGLLFTLMVNHGGMI
jgi:hypothetical protein